MRIYEVRSHVHGLLSFGRIKKTLSYLETAVFTERDLRDTEVQRALGDGRLEIVPLRRPLEIEEDTLSMSKKDWERFHLILQDTFSRLGKDLSAVIREEGEKLRETLESSSVSIQKTSEDSGKTIRKSRREESEYLFTPKFTGGGTKVSTEKSSEKGTDLMSGVEALRRMKQGENDGR